MLYLQIGSKRVIILEPSNLDHLKDGGSVITPDKQILLVYTPDSKWLAEHMKDAMPAGHLDPEAFERIRKESLKRPEVKERPYHETEMVAGVVLDGQNRKPN